MIYRWRASTPSMPLTLEYIVKTLQVGFPLNENAAATEQYATLTIDGYEARFAMTGITAIVHALKDGLDTGRLSAYSVKEAITAFELLHERMWVLCDAADSVDTSIKTIA